MAGDTPIGAGMSGRYARALFELARDEGAIEAVEEDLRQMAQLLTESADLARLVSSPVFDRESQGRAFAAILDRAGCHSLTRKFIGLLANRRRLFALNAIIRDFLRLAAERRGEMTAQVLAARPLDSTATQALAAELKAMLKRDVKLDVKIDERLLGGLIVKVGSRMIDSSLATKLDNLALAMKEA